MAPSHDPTRYDDGIPRLWQGQPVLHGQDILSHANATGDATPFLIGFWAGGELPHSCPNIGPGDVPTFVCGGMGDVGFEPGVYSSALGGLLRLATDGHVPGPIVAQVHTHDAVAGKCTTNVDHCKQVMFGDAILWAGDQATSATPSSVADAAAAFGISPTYDIAVCAGEQLPGVHVLTYPDPNAVGSTGMIEAAVAVFPSEAAVAIATPDAAAHGGSKAGPGSMNCAHSGTDALRGSGMFSFDMYWLARGNVLVGVQYDTSLGPDRDPIVAQVRTKLATLAGSGPAPAGPSPVPPTQAATKSGVFVPTGPFTMPTLGAGGTATLLTDGRVLVTPSDEPFSALYDPTTNRFSMSGLMSSARAYGSATRLRDGRVLLAGGDDGPTVLKSAELYDPRSGKFSPTGSLLAGREFHTATLLADGRVLIVGGAGDKPQGPNATLYASTAERYDPTTGRFTATGSPLETIGEGHSATMLSDGDVLICGGDGASNTGTGTNRCERFDPGTGTFSWTGSMLFGRDYHTATLLQDGRVLVTGGSSGPDHQDTATAEIYDPMPGTWTATTSLSAARRSHAAVLLRDGRVLVVGGMQGAGMEGLASAEIYDPKTGRFSATGPLAIQRGQPVAVALADGRALVISGTPLIDKAAEVYGP